MNRIHVYPKESGVSCNKWRCKEHEYIATSRNGIGKKNDREFRKEKINKRKVQCTRKSTIQTHARMHTHTHIHKQKNSSEKQENVYEYETCRMARREWNHIRITVAKRPIEFKHKIETRSLPSLSSQREERKENEKEKEKENSIKQREREERCEHIRVSPHTDH